MRKIYRALLAALRSLRAPAAEAEPFADFTLHDWADLPVHHPAEATTRGGARK